jgi:hypothetical protein
LHIFLLIFFRIGGKGVLDTAKLGAIDDITLYSEEEEVRLLEEMLVSAKKKN